MLCMARNERVLQTSLFPPISNSPCVQPTTGASVHAMNLIPRWHNLYAPKVQRFTSPEIMTAVFNFIKCLLRAKY